MIDSMGTGFYFKDPFSYEIKFWLHHLLESNYAGQDSEATLQLIFTCPLHPLTILRVRLFVILFYWTIKEEK